MKSRVWDADRTVTQPFGPSQVTAEPPLFGYPHFHKGIDLAMPIGTNLYAPEDGTCSNQKDQWGANYQFIVFKDGRACLLVHLNDFVASGVVKKGQLISHSGNTGNSSGPHLHFELRSSHTDINSCIDPVPFLSETGGDTMLPKQYLAPSNGEGTPTYVYKYADDPTVRYAIPNKEAFDIGGFGQVQIETVPYPENPDQTAQIASLNATVADLQKQLAQKPTEPSSKEILVSNIKSITLK